MNSQRKCVVIKNGSHTTVAGFSNTELPQCILPSSYIKRDDEYIFGTIDMLEVASERDSAKKGEVYTIIDENGVPYNWEALERQWKHIFENELKCKSDEFPLVITVPIMKDAVALRVMERYFDLAFNKFNVPVLQVIIEPLAIALSMGKSSALVVDLGSSSCNVTPIIDGTVAKNSVLKTKYAGDFLDYQIYEKLKSKIETDEEGDIDTGMKTSTDVWLDSNTWIQEFKSTMLQVSDKDLMELERYYKEQAQLYIKQQEELQKYQNITSANGNIMTTLNPATIASINTNNPLTVKKHFLFKPKNRTVTMETRECFAMSEYLFNPQLANENFSSEDGLGEIIGKSIKKAAASISSSGVNTLGSTGASMTLQGLKRSQINGSSTSNSSGNENSAATTASSTTPEQIYSTLLTNVIITGSTSLISGMEQRIIKELSIRFPQYKLTTFANQIMMDRRIEGWIAAMSMANLPSWELGKWYSKEDYELQKKNSLKQK